jgi:aspartate/methionine/tyrosine aminotransferase
MMSIQPFALERYFARYEFAARHLLSCSDCEPLTMADLLAMAGDRTKQLWDDLTLRYTDTQGHPALRDAIAALYADLAPDDVLTVVPEEGIFLLMQALLAPGDHVVCTFPGYQSLYAVAQSIGCSVSFWTGDEDRGWRFDLAQLEKLLQRSTRLVVVNFPHNPTGHLPGHEDFAALIDLVRDRGIHLLSDEMYRFLERDAADTLPAACTLYDKAITLGGLSKSFGLPGLRLGWTATRDRELLARMAGLKDYTTICGSAPSEILGIAALENRETIVSAHKTRLANNTAVLDRFLADFDAHFEGHRPRAGSLCFPRMTAVADTHAFCQELVREAGIMLVPSRMFGFGDRHVRIGLGRKDFPRVLGRFADYLRMRFG